jgi:hypothetical protein
MRLAARRVEGPWGWTPTGLRGDEDPAWLHAAVSRGPLVIAITRVADGPGLRIGCGQGGLSCTHGGGNTGDPRERRLSELVAVVRAREGTRGHHGGGARHGVPGRDVGTAHLATWVGLTAVAPERCHQEGDPGLRLHQELHHDGGEVRAMIATSALGEGHNLCLGLRVALVVTLDMNARRVEVRRGWTQAQPRGGAHRQETGPCWHPIGIEGLQGATARIIMELGGGHAGRNESRGGLMMDASGHQGAGWMDTPQAIEPHRVDGFPDGAVAHVRVLVRRLVKDVAHTTFVEPASHQAEVIPNLARVRGRVGHHSRLCW